MNMQYMVRIEDYKSQYSVSGVCETGQPDQLHDNNTSKQSQGLRFVQLMKNKATTPYKAVFDTPTRMGLTFAPIPHSDLLMKELLKKNAMNFFIRCQQLNEECRKRDDDDDDNNDNDNNDDNTLASTMATEFK